MIEICMAKPMYLGASVVLANICIIQCLILHDMYVGTYVHTYMRVCRYVGTHVCMQKCMHAMQVAR